MSKLIWDALGERYYETGVSNGALYPYNVLTNKYLAGVAWNGLTACNLSPEGAEANDFYADNMKYFTLISVETLKATIEAYYSPVEFDECDGTASIATGVSVGQQTRKPFGFAYKTILGNDTEENDYGYKIHILYGCKASPSERSSSTVNDSPEPGTLSWELSTTPVAVKNKKNTAHVTIDSSKISAAGLALIEAYLFGVDEFSSTLTYAVGEFVVEGTKVYRATTAVTTPGAFDEENWEEMTGMTGDPTLLLPDEIAAVLATVPQG